MELQLAYANEYVRRFGGKLVLGRSPADPVRVTGIPSERFLIAQGETETLDALRELDARCHSDYLDYLEVCSETARG
jgi:hypothetical protein